MIFSGRPVRAGRAFFRFNLRVTSIVAREFALPFADAPCARNRSLPSMRICVLVMFLPIENLHKGYELCAYRCKNRRGRHVSLAVAEFDLSRFRLPCEGHSPAQLCRAAHTYPM